jgi:hypothetical protein
MVLKNVKSAKHLEYKGKKKTRPPGERSRRDGLSTEFWWRRRESNPRKWYVLALISICYMFTEQQANNIFRLTSLIKPSDQPPNTQRTRRRIPAAT